MKRMAFALIALLCLAVFTLPKVAEAKSPPGAAQVSQGYQLNISDSTAEIAGYQHINIVANDGSEVDIGARALTSTCASQIALTTPTQGHALAFGRAATNERVRLSGNMATNNYSKRARDASRQHRPVARE
jgi:hypothetical protein